MYNYWVRTQLDLESPQRYCIAYLYRRLGSGRSSGGTNVFQARSRSTLKSTRRNYRTCTVSTTARLAPASSSTPPGYPTMAEIPLRIALEVIPTITGSVSFVSSVYLLYRILRERRCSKSKTRDQLLLGLSSLDVCGSLGLSFSTFVAPIGRDWSRGTIETCTMQGFLVQLGLGVPLYNAALCIYFILAVRYNIPDSRLSRWMVPAVHLTVLPYILGTATYGAATNVFNFAGSMGCWAHGVAKTHCQQIPALCGRGSTANEFTWNFAGYHIVLSFITVVVSMIIVYCTVRTIERSSTLPRIQAVAFEDTAEEDPAIIFGEGTPEHLRASQEDGETPPLPRRFARVSTAPTPLTDTARDTGLYYGFTFILVYLASFVLILVDFGRDTRSYQAVVLLNAIFLPLQGFFNLIIYTTADWRSWVRKQVTRCLSCWKKGTASPTMQFQESAPPSAAAASVELKEWSGISRNNSGGPESAVRESLESTVSRAQ